MRVYPDAHASSKRDPFFWSLAVAASLAILAPYVAEATVLRTALELLLCGTVSGWLIAMQPEEPSGTAVVADWAQAPTFTPT